MKFDYSKLPGKPTGPKPLNPPWQVEISDEEREAMEEEEAWDDDESHIGDPDHPAWDKDVGNGQTLRDLFNVDGSPKD